MEMEGHRQRIRGLDDCRKIGYGGGGGLWEKDQSRRQTKRGNKLFRGLYGVGEHEDTDRLLREKQEVAETFHTLNLV